MLTRCLIVVTALAVASCSSSGSPDTGLVPADFPYCEVDEAKIDTIYSSMTLRERVGQHLVVGVDSDGKGGLSSDAVRKLTEYAVGGAFISPVTGIVLNDPLTTATFIHNVKVMGFKTTGVPLFVCLDQEGGPNSAVNSLTGGTDTIGSMPIGATGEPSIAYEEFDIMAREIRAMGFNMDLGPVLDTLLSTRNGNLNTRAFGPDPALNAALGIEALTALQMNMVLAVAKHFPGDGISDGNTHQTHVYVEEDMDFLEATILGPFRAAVKAGVDGIMTIPAAYTAIDPDRSAITSRAVTTELLREDMGFDGLVVTDSLGMEGVGIGIEEGELRGMEALRAGADILLYVTAIFGEEEAVYQRVKQELEGGTWSEAEFEESTKRILRMKQRYCLFEDPTGPDEDDLSTLEDRLAHGNDKALSRSHADKAVVLLHDNGTLPLTGKNALYVGPGTVFQDPGSQWINVVDQTFGDAMMKHDPGVKQINYFMPMNPNEQYALVEEQADGVDVIVMGTLQGRFSLEQQQLLEWVLEGVDKPLVHVILGVPFDYAQTRTRAAAAIALMGSRSTMVEAGAAVLYGEQQAQGNMLFDLEKLAGQTGFQGPKEPSTTPDRCEKQGIECSGNGICVDAGTQYGCVCHPNWHTSSDGLDCIPDGS